MAQERYNAIIRHPVFVDCMERIKAAEQTRKFCGHGFCHLLDVCRIAYMINLENGALIAKDVVYAAGLLHDLGRAAQYEQGAGHAEESAVLAAGIMRDCGYTPEEIRMVAEAIRNHRQEAFGVDRNLLGQYLYTADKKSRNCFFCKASTECNWAEEKKNKGIY